MRNGKLGGTGDDAPVNFKASDVMRAQLGLAARGSGLTVSEWIRRALARALRRVRA